MVHFSFTAKKWAQLSAMKKRDDIGIGHGRRRQWPLQSRGEAMLPWVIVYSQNTRYAREAALNHQRYKRTMRYRHWFYLLMRYWLPLMLSWECIYYFRRTTFSGEEQWVPSWRVGRRYNFWDYYYIRRWRFERFDAEYFWLSNFSSTANWQLHAS